MSTGITPTLLEALWRERRPSGPPIAHTFRSTYAGRWVRFHSLPGSKRYPESENEYMLVLERYNTILDELFTGLEVFVVTMDWSYTPTGSAGYRTPRQELHPDGVRWWIESDDDDPDRSSTPTRASTPIGAGGDTAALMTCCAPSPTRRS